MIDSTKRFSDRVDNYQRFRPSYTTDAIEYIFGNFGLSPESVLADIGSGTGIFTEKLLPRCKTVFAVEPNREMRSAAEKRLSFCNSYKSVDGTAEKTTLDKNSVDGITVAQAFHWFNIEKTRKEFKRILKKDGTVFLVWNKREINTPFLKAYDSILTENIPEYTAVNYTTVTPQIIKTVLIRDYAEAVFQNNRTVTLEEVLGRLNSSSYMPKPGSKEHEQIEGEIIAAFNRYSENGLTAFNYNTEIYSGKIT